MTDAQRLLNEAAAERAFVGQLASITIRERIPPIRDRSIAKLAAIIRK